jgi:hypothetical protein
LHLLRVGLGDVREIEDQQSAPPDPWPAPSASTAWPTRRRSSGRARLRDSRVSVLARATGCSSALPISLKRTPPLAAMP